MSPIPHLMTIKRKFSVTSCRESSKPPSALWCVDVSLVWHYGSLGSVEWHMKEKESWGGALIPIRGRVPHVTVSSLCGGSGLPGAKLAVIISGTKLHPIVARASWAIYLLWWIQIYCTDCLRVIPIVSRATHSILQSLAYVDGRASQPPAVGSEGSHHITGSFYQLWWVGET